MTEAMAVSLSSHS